MKADYGRFELAQHVGRFAAEGRGQPGQRVEAAEERGVRLLFLLELAAQRLQLGVLYRPTTPSSGDEAEAYILRGMRPARNASRPASTALRIAVAMRTGSAAMAMAEGPERGLKLMDEPALAELLAGEQ